VKCFVQINVAYFFLNCKDAIETEKSGGKVHRIESLVFFAEDVVNELSVVDSIGQRLVLGIENSRGGGGQRSIAVFSPFWIINTTEHALRYRQEKSKAYVSGTIVSPSENGSLPVSGARPLNGTDRIEASTSKNPRPLSTNTIFPSMPGALATTPGRCDLISEDLSKFLDGFMPLKEIAKIAFMFNFHEGAQSIGHNRLCVQLNDGTVASSYQSDWSIGFGLDSAGFSQPISYVNFCFDSIFSWNICLSSNVFLAPYLECIVEMGVHLS
jgi:hypothetical protein